MRLAIGGVLSFGKISLTRRYCTGFERKSGFGKAPSHSQEIPHPSLLNFHEALAHATHRRRKISSAGSYFTRDFGLHEARHSGIGLATRPLQETPAQSLFARMLNMRPFQAVVGF